MTLSASPSRSWPAHAGLPWRVYTTERARSYVNAAAWPPLLPTARMVTAGFVVAVVAELYSVATAVAPDERVAVGGAVELHRLADDAGSRLRSMCRR